MHTTLSESGTPVTKRPSSYWVPETPQSKLAAVKSGLVSLGERIGLARLVMMAMHEVSFLSHPPVDRKRVFAPIFVVGCGHSGTSITLAILSNHSKIFAVPGESDAFMYSAVSRLSKLRSWTTEATKAGKSRWAEKTPLHIWYLDRIFSYYPQAKVIITLRDGRDNALSHFRSWGDFEESVTRWVNDNTEGMRFWSHPNVRVVKYEDLVSNQETTIREICKFIGEEFEPDMIHTERQDRKWYSSKTAKPTVVNRQSHADYRNWQINQPLSSGYCDRWRSEMSLEQKELFKRLAGRLLIQLGYEKDNDW